MRLLHTADLHIGKHVNGFNMLEDQRYILKEIIEIARVEKVHGILITGDIYDRSQPSAEAVDLLDEFLTELRGLGQPVFIIGGNHDSPERLSFACRILKQSHLHIAGIFGGTLDKVSLEDEYGRVNIYMLPFLKPATVRPYFEEKIESYEDAVGKVLENAKINIKERNVLLCHQFLVSGKDMPRLSDSESINVGGLDHIDVSYFDDFDYVALGHLHRPQSVGRGAVRYAGSPLKYSFSEANHKKSISLIELGKKGEIATSQILLRPLRDLREIKGPIEELLKVGRENIEGSQDYMRVVLTDKEDIYDALGRLREVYPNLMVLDLENRFGFGVYELEALASADPTKKCPLDLFSEFYQIQNDDELEDKQVELMKNIFEEAGGINI